MHLTESIRRACDSRMLTLLVLFDFSKAFDAVDHAVLLRYISALDFPSLLSITINSVPIPYVASPRILGVRLASALSWQEHVTEVTGKIYRSLHQIKLHRDLFNTSMRKHLTDPTSLWLLCCCVCWPPWYTNHTTAACVQRLRTLLQHHPASIVLGSPLSQEPPSATDELLTLCYFDYSGAFLLVLVVRPSCGLFRCTPDSGLPWAAPCSTCAALKYTNVRSPLLLRTYGTLCPMILWTLPPWPSFGTPFIAACSRMRSGMQLPSLQPWD